MRKLPKQSFELQIGEFYFAYLHFTPSPSFLTRTERGATDNTLAVGEQTFAFVLATCRGGNVVMSIFAGWHGWTI